jgi:uncharacterized membrane protein
VPRGKRGEARRESRKESRRESRAEQGRELRDPRGPRLDVPRETRILTLPRFEDDAFGRFAERFARFMGTAKFLVYMTAFVIVWVSINLVGMFGLQWDPYPFILLNLFFSTQASYAAPLILLAQNRQEDRDRVIAEGDRLANSRAHADMEFLAREMASLRMALGEVATRDYLRSELRTLLAELDERSARDDDRERDEREEGDPRAGETAPAGPVG